MDLRAETDSDSFTPGGLFANDENIRGGKVTVVSGAGVLKAGTVIGKAFNGTAASAAKAGGNTGTGTLVLDVGTPELANLQPGIYQLRCTIAQADAGVFTLTDPKGAVIGEIVSTLAGTVFADRLKFALTTIHGHDFIVGDGFDITVAAGSGKYNKSIAAAVDGTQTPDAILGEDIDATAADQEAMVYFGGEFNSDNLTIDGSLTVAGISDGLRTKGIFLK